MSTLEKRIEQLEERRNTRKSRIAVIKQSADGSWPPEPPGASLVVGIRNFRYADGASAPAVAED